MITFQMPLFQLLILHGLRSHLSLQLILPLIVEFKIGTPVGVYLLQIFERSNYRKASRLYDHTTVGLVHTHSLARSNSAWRLLAGFGIGVVDGSISAAGPIVILYFTLRGLRKEEFKATSLALTIRHLRLLIPLYA